MQTVYYVKMSGGRTLHVPANSAADAMQVALETALGQTVTKCWTEFKAFRRGNPTGVINYDIPKHEALKVKPETVRPPQREQGPCTLFDDAEVLKESEKALERRG